MSTTTKQLAQEHDDASIAMYAALSQMTPEQIEKWREVMRAHYDAGTVTTVGYPFRPPLSAGPHEAGPST